MAAAARSERVTATPAALAFLDEIRAAHGAVMLHQSAEVGDGSSPRCCAQDDYVVGENDMLLGFIAGSPFYVHASQVGAWARTQFVIDVAEGRSGRFSLDHGTGRRFLIRARVLPVEERAVGPVS